MEESRCRSSKNPGLPESYIEHYPEAFSEITDRETGSGKSKIADDPADGEGKHPDRNEQGKDKDQLFGHSYLDLISLTASTSWGRILAASPTMPYCAASKTGASLSVLTATMNLEALTPAICCVAPEMPMAK